MKTNIKSAQSQTLQSITRNVFKKINGVDEKANIF